jgi:hypothetical protein
MPPAASKQAVPALAAILSFIQVIIFRVPFTNLGGLLFPLLAAALGFERIGSGEPRGSIQPPGKGHSPAKGMRFPGQNDEYGLGHLLRKVRVADLPHSR